VPWDTAVAKPHQIGVTANRTIELAGSPVPSSTSVKESITELSVTPATARSFTAPGLPGTALVTVTVAASCTPSLVALIVAEPTATAVASPLPSTVTPALFDAHVIARPVSVLLLASFNVAANCCVAPTVRLGLGGLIVTDATGGGGAGGVVASGF